MTQEHIPVNHPRLICTAVGLAMGIAVLVLSLMHKIQPESAILMLSIGVTMYGAALLLFNK
ncbi:MAG: hypothetical protein ALMCE001_05090 [Methanocorpusculum sp. MCE]|nr:MAG: hypothetical protein ALMCE001_05090 [Methanocorpusculum sp. MCE]